MSCLDSESWATVNFQLATVDSCLPFEGSVASNTFSVDFVWGCFWAFTFLSAVIPVMGLFASKFASSLSSVPNKRFQTFDAFASQINRESFWANAFILSLIPNVVGSTFVGWLRDLSFLTIMSIRVELGAGGTGYTFFFVKIEDRSGLGAVDAFGIRSLEEGSLDGTLGDVIVSDESIELLVVVVDGLVADDPVGSVKVGDAFKVGLGFRDSPGSGSGPGERLLNRNKNYDLVGAGDSCD